MKLILITAGGRTDSHKVTEGCLHLHVITAARLGDTVIKGMAWSYKLTGVQWGLPESALEAAYK